MTEPWYETTWRNLKRGTNTSAPIWIIAEIVKEAERRERERILEVIDSISYDKADWIRRRPSTMEVCWNMIIQQLKEKI